jgi:HTH-type transcriptional regulator/antitoxin HipB
MRQEYEKAYEIGYALGDQISPMPWTGITAGPLGSGAYPKKLGARTNLRQATISSLEAGEGATLDTVFPVITHLKLELHMDKRNHSPAPLEEIC